MSRFRSHVLVGVVAVCLMSKAVAAPLPSYTGAMNKAVAAVIEKTATRRGLSMTGSVAADTLAALGVAAGSRAALAVGAAAVASAPAWLSVAAFFGSAALAAGAAYGVYKLFFDEPTSKAGFVLKKPGANAGGSTPPASPAIVPSVYTSTIGTYSAPVGSSVGSGTTVYTPPTFPMDTKAIPISTTQQYYIAPSYFQGVWVSCNVGTECLQIALDWYKKAGAVFNPDYAPRCTEPIIDAGQGGMPTSQSCSFHYKMNPAAASYTYAGASMNFARNPYYAGASPVTLSGPIADIVAAIPEQEMAKPADPAIVASVANNLWQHAAAQEGYKGVPYSATDPVTVADAVAVQSANAASWPTNADLVAPVAASPGAAVTIGVAPAVVPDTGTQNPPVAGLTNVNVVNTPSVRIADPVDINWGTTVAVAEPSLAETPTAQQVLAPVTTLMPGLKNLVIPRPGALCPTASFTVLDHAFTVDSHCDVIQAAKPTLFPVMAFVWLAVAAMIVLRA